MNRESKYVIRPCDCRCCMFVVDKTIWEDGSVDYNISIQDSRYDHNCSTLWGRLKRAFSILFGRPVYYSDVFLPDEKAYNELLREMQELQGFRGSTSGHPKEK